MILSDLLGLRAVDTDGIDVGWITDVRFEIAPTAGDGVPSATIFGLLVSSRRDGSWFGFERTDVRHPRPIVDWIRWRHRGSFLVPWADVERIEPPRAVLRRGHRRDAPTLPS